MAAEVVQSMQTVVFSIPNGVSLLLVAVTHGLVDRDGNALTPNVIIPEIISLSGGTFPFNFAVLPIERSTPEDGTFDMTVAGLTVNASGAPWVVTARVTCLYTHSLMGSDRTA